MLHHGERETTDFFLLNPGGMGPLASDSSHLSVPQNLLLDLAMKFRNVPRHDFIGFIIGGGDNETKKQACVVRNFIAPLLMLKILFLARLNCDGGY
jgi:hypothetical protein